MRSLLLASTSAARSALLSQLRVPFACHAPNVDETPLPGEDALSLVKRLSESKALAAAEQYPDHIIIAGDQVADFQGQIIGKPGSIEQAQKVLEGFAGQSIVFQGGLCVMVPATGFCSVDVIPTTVTFRQNTAEDIAAYLKADPQPAFHCAGGLKVEALGIGLVASIESTDPNALIGLPLIQLLTRLKAAGFDLWKAAHD